MADRNTLVRRVLAIMFAAAALAAAWLIYVKYGAPSLNPPGSSDVDQDRKSVV